MRVFFLFVLAVPLAAEQSFLSCEPDAATLRLLEAVPPIAERSLPYEQRGGAVRTLAQTHPNNFFIQRAYQDSFRQHRTLADEFDRALAMYRARASGPLSKYWEARLLRWHAPARSRNVLEETLVAHPKFAWPHLDISEYSTLPGQRNE